MSVCFELPQESENALAIKIREQVIKKLSECKSEEELKNALLTILSQNNETLSLDKIQTKNETLNRLENLLVCQLADNTTDGLTQTQIELSSLIRNTVDLICNPPELRIPYPYPVLDLSDDFLNKLLLSLLRLVIKILFSILKKLLNILIEICNSGLTALNAFNSQNIANIIKNSIGEEVGSSFIEDVFKLFNVNSDGTIIIIQEDGEICADQQQADAFGSNMGNISNLLDDLSSVLTPVEICSLLNGRANDLTFQVVEEILNFEYPTIRRNLNTRAKIESLFKILGSRNDPSICELIEANAETIISRPELCFTEDAEQIRRGILEDKQIPEEEIRNQLQKERERNKKNLEKISELVASVRTNPDKIFGEVPNIFCKNGSPGLFGLDDLPSLKKSVSETFDASFNPFFISFSGSTNNFKDSIVYSEEIPVSGSDVSKVLKKFISLTITTEDGDTKIIKDSISSKFMQKVTSGQYILCDQFGNTSDIAILNYYKD